jgi:hypothetical protein
LNTAFCSTIASFLNVNISSVKVLSTYTVFSDMYFECSCNSSNLPVQVSKSLLVQVQVTSLYDAESAEISLTDSLSELSSSFEKIIVSGDYIPNFNFVQVPQYVIFSKYDHKPNKL